jgi:hypothetical protein
MSEPLNLITPAFLALTMLFDLTGLWSSAFLTLSFEES